MPYSQFTTISKVKEAFGLKTHEGGRFIPISDCRTNSRIFSLDGSKQLIGVIANFKKYGWQINCI